MLQVTQIVTYRRLLVLEDVLRALAGEKALPTQSDSAACDIQLLSQAVASALPTMSAGLYPATQSATLLLLCHPGVVQDCTGM